MVFKIYTIEYIDVFNWTAQLYVFVPARILYCHYLSVMFNFIFLKSFIKNPSLPLKRGSGFLAFYGFLLPDLVEDKLRRNVVP